MPTNPYFNQQTFQDEQNLLQDLMDEAIQIHGVNTYYLTRQTPDIDRLFGEDDLSRFPTAKPIEMYIKDTTSFKGQSDFMSKFGLQIEDQCTFSVSTRRFAQAVPDLDRPREGDIVWVQLKHRGVPNRYLFEIKFVEDKEQLFQLGDLYTYELRCELMTYSHEIFSTGVIDDVEDINIDIDQEADTLTFTVALEMIVSGTGYGNTVDAFALHETLYQGTATQSTARGRVASINGSEYKIRDVVGTWSLAGGLVRSANSDAVGTLAAIDGEYPDNNDPIADNRTLVDESDNIIVIRGTNPRTA